MALTLRRLLTIGLIAVVACGGMAGAVIDSAVAGPKTANLSQPNVPSVVSAGKLIGITGTIDKAAASGPIRLLFYQKIRGEWVLQKTEYARWSGWNATTTKYVLDTRIPYAGEWRIGASYGGNKTYSPDYKYRDFVVAPKASANLSQPNVPSKVVSGNLIGITGTIDKAAASGPIRLLFYQKIRGEWVLQKTEYARWSGWNATTTKYVLDTRIPYAGEWRIGASYGGNRAYSADYKYRDFVVEPKSTQAGTLSGVNAWVSNSKPSQYTDVTAYAKCLDRDGRPVQGATVKFTWNYKTVTHTMTATSNSNGTAQVTRYIAGATIGNPVTIDVVASKDGVSRATWTFFTPQ